MIDYRLNEIPDDTGKRYPHCGTALVGQIRDRCPEHPIYLVCRLLDEHVLQEGTELFDRLMTHQSLKDKEHSGKRILMCDAQDYRKVRNVTKRKSVAPIFTLLHVPSNLRNALKDALPTSLKAGIGPATKKVRYSEIAGTVALTDSFSGTIRFTRWIHRNLLKHPGLLYSDLHAATYLGMNEKYFNEYFSKKLQKLSRNDLLYQGIFSETHPRRWWRECLSGYVYGLKQARNHPTKKIWEVAPEILKLKPHQKARCYVCRRFYPESVGHDVDDPEIVRPVHWSCSTIDQNHQPSIHFEQRRIFEKE